MNSISTKTYSPTPDKIIAEKIFKTSIDGLFYIESDLFNDERGFFRGVSLIPDLNDVLKKPFTVQQINHSRSATNVVRGMHAENWNKLITVVSGLAYCVLADVRPLSPTFLNVEYFILGSEENTLFGSLFISKQIANSLCVLKGPVDYVYCFDQLYRDRDKKGDQAVSLFDPDLKIQWPIEREKMIISKRDNKSITLRELYPDAFK